MNGFDESFTGWGHEDSDLVVRLFNAGVMRKDGAFATEVFHLWHREATRDQESSNKKLVVRAREGWNSARGPGIGRAPVHVGTADLTEPAILFERPHFCDPHNRQR